MGHKSDGFGVSEGVPAGRATHGLPFTLSVPGRQFPLSAECDEEREQWINALKEVISTPLTAQDSSREFLG